MRLLLAALSIVIVAGCSSGADTGVVLPTPTATAYPNADRHANHSCDGHRDYHAEANRLANPNAIRHTDPNAIRACDFYPDRHAIRPAAQPPARIRTLSIPGPPCNTTYPRVRE